MIHSIQIDNLFGRFNYNISTKSEGITIITGPNGFGKSTILRIINALSKGSIDYFMRLDFSSLEVSFDNDQKIVIKNGEKGISIDDLKLPFFNEERQEYTRFIQRRPWLQKTPGGFIDRRTDEYFTEDEYFYRIFLEDDRYYEHYGNKS